MVTEIVGSRPFVRTVLSPLMMTVLLSLLEDISLGTSELPFGEKVVLGDVLRLSVGVEVGIGVGVGPGRAFVVLCSAELGANELTPCVVVTTVFVRAETGILTPGGP